MDWDRLKVLNDRLTSLMSDPHPGLITWVEAANKAVEDMMNFLNGESS